jgi:glycosyltransferase involved in cell wall biosynthesis
VFDTDTIHRSGQDALPRLAVLLPCFNEAGAIGHVVAAFQAALPDATIYVYDNNSTDDTAAAAARAGAVVRHETRQGKGHVVRRMFADIDADVYVLADGDDTYEAAAATGMVQMLLEDRLDMVTGTRVSTALDAYRPGHQFGNWALTTLAGTIFGERIPDMLSGYRVFSRRFVKSFPALATGFETETEFTIHALEMRMPTAALETVYKDRAPGTASKLRTYSDGLRILVTIFRLVRLERPMQFFGLVGIALALLSLILAAPVIVHYVQTGLVPRLPTALLATGCMLLSSLCFAVAMILESVSNARKEIKRLAYIAIPPFPYVTGDSAAANLAASRPRT